MNYATKAKIILIICVIILTIFIITTAKAMTATTHKYITSKALLEQVPKQCEQDLLLGSIMPDDSNNWSTNPDFVSINHHCTNNEPDCKAKQKAQKYKTQALQETECEQAKTIGIMSHFLVDSLTPAHWQSYESSCHSKFEQKIEKHITNLETEWVQSNECTDKNTGKTILLTYSNKDLNQTIQTLREYWTGTTTTPTIQQIQVEETALIEYIKKFIGTTKPTDKEIEITAKVITEALTIQCLIPTEKKTRLYENYQQMRWKSKQCLPYFLKTPATQAYTFIQQCPLLTQTYSMEYAIWDAEETLQEYYELEFADITAKTVQMPTTTGFQTQAPTLFDYQILQYTPKKLAGCIEEFKQWDKIRDETSTNTAGTIILLGLTTLFIGGWIFVKIKTGGGW